VKPRRANFCVADNPTEPIGKARDDGSCFRRVRDHKTLRRLGLILERTG
jgi:hypothetical protein